MAWDREPEAVLDAWILASGGSVLLEHFGYGAEIHDQIVRDWPGGTWYDNDVEEWASHLNERD